MPVRRIASLFIVVALLGGCETATRSPAPAAGEAAAKAEMLAAMRASAEGWNAGDLRRHLAIYDGTVTVMTKAGPRPTVEAIEASFSAAYFKDGKPRQALSFGNTEIRLLSPTTALMTGRFLLAGGGLPDQSGWFTLVWLFGPAGWHVIHDHTS